MSPLPNDVPGRQPGLTVPLAAALVLFVVLFWRLGAPSFWDPDEAHYAETTRELITTGDWLAPYYNDQPFFDKPLAGAVDSGAPNPQRVRNFFIA